MDLAARSVPPEIDVEDGLGSMRTIVFPVLGSGGLRRRLGRPAVGGRLPRGHRHRRRADAADPRRRRRRDQPVPADVDRHPWCRHLDRRRGRLALQLLPQQRRHARHRRRAGHRGVPARARPRNSATRWWPVRSSDTWATRATPRNRSPTCTSNSATPTGAARPSYWSLRAAEARQACTIGIGPWSTPTARRRTSRTDSSGRLSGRQRRRLPVDDLRRRPIGRRSRSGSAVARTDRRTHRRHADVRRRPVGHRLRGPGHRHGRRRADHAAPRSPVRCRPGDAVRNRQRGLGRGRRRTRSTARCSPRPT